RMGSLDNQFDRDLSIRIELKYSKSFVGPIDLSGGNIPSKAPGMADLLRFLKVRFAALQFAGLLNNVRFGAFSVFDVECSYIPAIDFSLGIEQRVVADQEPPIFPVLPEHTLLVFEWYGTRERVSALLAQPFHVLRVKEASAIVLFPHILQSQAGVTQNRLI